METDVHGAYEEDYSEDVHEDFRDDNSIYNNNIDFISNSTLVSLVRSIFGRCKTHLEIPLCVTKYSITN